MLPVLLQHMYSVLTYSFFVITHLERASIQASDLYKESLAMPCSIFTIPSSSRVVIF